MPEHKNRRVAAAVGFLAGVLTCLNAVKDARIVWPPDALWDALPHPQRLEIGAGIALILIVLITTFVPHQV